MAMCSIKNQYSVGHYYNPTSSFVILIVKEKNK